MKKQILKQNSILNTELFKKFKEELAKDYDFSEIDKQLDKKSDKYTHLGRS